MLKLANNPRPTVGTQRIVLGAEVGFQCTTNNISGGKVRFGVYEVIRVEEPH